jgi:hypothetical protein
MTSGEFLASGQCPKCKLKLQRKYHIHVKACEAKPSAQEISDMLNADASETLSKIARRNKTNADWIRRILLTGDVGWTVDTLEKRINGKCPICFLSISQMASRHIEHCETLPPPEELDRMMREDKYMSVTEICRRYEHAHSKRIIRILMGHCGWTRKEISKKGYAAKVAKHERDRKKYRPRDKPHGKPTCKCGIIVRYKGALCQFCDLESHGIKSYKDMHND